ncbi:hypothetical protein ACJX0J_040345, partial [Zea mays]
MTLWLNEDAPVGSILAASVEDRALNLLLSHTRDTTWAATRKIVWVLNLVII